jgi:hypothetical protein
MKGGILLLFRLMVMCAVCCLCLLSACGTSSELMSSAIGDKTLTLDGIALSSDQAGWAVGQHENSDASLHAAVIQLTHGSWQYAALPDFGAGSSLNAIALSDAQDGWAVGKTKSGALVVRLKHGVWQQQPISAPDALNALVLTTHGDGWAVGDGGAILHMASGVWSVVPSPTTLALQAVTVAPDGTAWIVGQNGIVLRQNGQSWVQQRVAGASMLTGIAAISASDLWATGWHGLLAHGVNNAWARVPTRHTWSILAIAITSVGGWVVGDGGLMIAYQGGQSDKWNEADCTTDYTLNALAVISPSEGWAVGDEGTIIRLHDGKWSQPMPIR